MTKKTGLKIHITGVVQGVGFRPFVYGLATRFALKGWVKNTSAGVDIEVDGDADILDAFARALRDEAPLLSRIDDFTVTPVYTRNEETGVIWAGFSSFDILHSQAVEGAFQPISPDYTICDDCLRELFDPDDHRYRYPFINCTNCGPRFTIIKDIPYDRPKTTMATFPLCEVCAKEYQDPLDRRFHAQPVACPDCGPKVWLEEKGKKKGERDGAILETQKLLLDGKILAIKGLGGFHLACDATNATAVSELRSRKLRVDKPFALMMPDLTTVERHCFLNDAEKEELESLARPIVLLKRKPDSPIAKEVAPGQDHLGVMLPYTPLHYLLFAASPRSDDFSRPARNPEGLKPSLRGDDSNFQPVTFNLPPLVMTSGNLSEEPIAFTNEDARERLSSLADSFLMHNRDIHIRCDDSVARIFEKEIYPLRRSRGYAPFPVKLPWDVPPLLAAGAELKSTFCITNQNYAFMSHHIGDLSNFETLQSFEQGIDHFEKLFRVKPEAIAYDIHPNYLATRYALERAERENILATDYTDFTDKKNPRKSVKSVADLIPTQHHHAHIASVMAENGLKGEEKVIGVAFDGTGYGDDGNIWGGEFLIADYAGYERAAHLPYFPLAGGDAATKRPARTALGLLWELGIDWDEYLPPMQNFCSEERMALRIQLERKLNTPLTSSMGRLFDAAAALAGGRQTVNYEAQGAIEFEALASTEFTRHFYRRSNLLKGETAYPYRSTRSEQVHAPRRVIEEGDAGDGYYDFGGEQAQITLRSGILSLLKDVQDNIPISIISAKFHNGIAEMVLKTCVSLREKSGVNTVALSGGVWQNIFLLERTLDMLRLNNFEILIHRQVPANDGGLALGQAAIAAWKLK
ncbi:MAG: carbamoyltransferase HypF [Anaerolineae bacterium]|nr:carbamoyltransferase HypF [Anaerolineae bacterium]MBT7991173.1 carbamoyltransferase HypF [Anaerolineae bacterium]